uniref:GRAM domain-containing protein n=1 Tax=Neogobius melanostomus TaxID=47308 RepID=A0A8C6SNP2_9GOBI
MSEAPEENRRCRRTTSVTKHDDRENHSDVEPLSEERHWFSRAASDPAQGEDQESARRKPALVRSKTFDNSLLRDAPTDGDHKIERKKSHYSQLSKTNGHFHKIFKEISKEEHLQQSYTCALQKDILYQGRMFVSEHWICFHSKVFGKDTKIAIPVVSVTNIKKTKTARLLPNAVVVSTSNDRYVFVSFLSRDNTYKFLLSACLHLEEKSPCSSPIPSSANSSFRAPSSPLSPHFPLAFSGDFVEPRPDLAESSSSDSQTPDYDKINEFPVPDFLLNRSGKPPSPKLSEHLQKIQVPVKQGKTALGRKHRGAEATDGRSLKTLSLSTLLCVYLLLVCLLLLSSCYLAFKILSLEQKLSSLGSLPALTDHHDVLRATADVNSDLFLELITINLLKLEKVQRNLQRLLEETA